jgi:recombination protein RecA
MAERRRLQKAKKGRKRRRQVGDAFYDDDAPNEFIPTGSTLLDCVLTGGDGGWVAGRVANIVGDKSTGKTLLAIEACANFARRYPQGRIYYREAEAAFDKSYAETLGLPVNRVNFGPKGLNSDWSTIERIFDDIRKVAAQHKEEGVPGLYIIDSLDAVGSNASKEREAGATGYKLEKPKIMSEMFCDIISTMKAANLSLIVISQVRDRIGMTVGDKQKRSGGRALDFYATHVVWLTHIKTLTRTIGHVKRATAVRIRAKCKKNKVAMPFRDCEFTLRFGFGIDDIESCVEWLEEVNRLEGLGITEKDKKKKAEMVDKFITDTEQLSGGGYQARWDAVRRATIAAWAEVEKSFLPERRKYS